MEPSVDLPYLPEVQDENDDNDDYDISYASDEIDVEIQSSFDDPNEYNANNSYSCWDKYHDDISRPCTDIQYPTEHSAGIQYPPEHRTDINCSYENVSDIQYPSEHDSDISRPSKHVSDNEYPSEHSADIENPSENSPDIEYPSEHSSGIQYPPEHERHVPHSPEYREEYLNTDTSSTSSSDDSGITYQYGDQFTNSHHVPNVILYSTGDNDSTSSIRHAIHHHSDYSHQSCPSSNLQFHPIVLKKKSVCMTYILTLFLGIFGAHHFYLGRPKFGTLYIFTGGLLGMGYVVDLVRVPWLVDNANLELSHPELRGRKYLMDAYLLWLPPFGLLGFHHFYLGNTCHALVYLVTVGAVLMGWLLDICLLPLIWISKANKDYSYYIESLAHGTDGEVPAGWNTDCTVITSPHSGSLPPSVISPPPYTEIDYTETDLPPSYNEVLAMDMQESFT